MDREIEIVEAESSIDGTRFSEVVDTLKDVIKRERFRHTGSTPITESDICIDITSGQKLYSIGGAMVSLNTDVIFSYVAGNGDVRIVDAGVSLRDTVV
jgi:hypothetical protein